MRVIDGVKINGNIVLRNSIELNKKVREGEIRKESGGFTPDIRTMRYLCREKCQYTRCRTGLFNS